jgi:DNA-binding transcriptional MerR regulator
MIFTIQELTAKTGVPARTLRHWIREKLVPKPNGRGRGARYDERHLIRTRVVQHLRATMSLRAIRSQIAAVSDEELAKLVPPVRAMTPEGLPAPPPAPTYPSTLWEVVHLMDGLVLMVNPTKPVVRRIADEIYRYYGGLGSA